MQAAAHTPGGYGGVPQAVGKEFTQDSATWASAPGVDSQNTPLAAMPVPAVVSRLAAGILFQSSDGQILLMRRGNGGDYPGTWGLPAGHLEGEESAEDAARRESEEETGFKYAGELTKLHDDGQFTTFLARIDEPFPVKLCDESDGYVWTTPDAAPAGMHPGLIPTLRVAAADTELAVAELIRDGVLSSPQMYANIALFDLRITGTGTAYRTKIEEHVYRAPENYLNDEFLARCNGLMVIMEHPKGSILDSKEFTDRSIGSIMLPYIKGDEVWGIAKIYDEPSIKMMSEEKLSTSPSVVFHSESENVNMLMDDGKHILIEGKPSLLDHLAICEAGVWDKGGEPSGVSSTLEGIIMADAEKTEDVKKADAEGGEKLDRLLAAVDSLTKRMDAAEKPASEPAPVAADKKKADDDDDDDAKKKADAEEEEKKKADAKKADDDSKRKADAEKEEAERPKFADCQAKADSVMSAFGDSAPRPMQGESLMAYRQRLASKLKVHSADYKDINLNAISDESLLAVAERRIYADAAGAARTSIDVPAGTLHEVKETDRAGRIISTFRGSPDAWMRQFKSPARRLHSINKGV